MSDTAEPKHEPHPRVAPDTDLIKRARKLLYVLGNVKALDGCPNEGLNYHRRAYAVFRATGDESGHDTATACYKLEIHYARGGELSTARSVYQGALEGKRGCRTGNGC